MYDLAQILQDYYEHLVTNRDTLLSRFFALFRIRPAQRYFLVMNNVLDSARNIHEVCMQCIGAVEYLCLYLHACLFVVFVDEWYVHMYEIRVYASVLACGICIYDMCTCFENVCLYLCACIPCICVWCVHMFVDCAI